MRAARNGSRSAVRSSTTQLAPSTAGPLGVERCSSHVLAVEPRRQRRRQRRRGVHDEQVASPQEARQLAEAGVDERVIGAARHQQRHVGAVGSADLGRLDRFERLAQGGLVHRGVPASSAAR